MFGWKYGLGRLDYLLESLLLFHFGLYYGAHRGAHDPWSCCVHHEEVIGYASTDLKGLFEQTTHLKTIAEIAIDVHAQKPESLTYQAPYVENQTALTACTN